MADIRASETAAYHASSTATNDHNFLPIVVLDIAVLDIAVRHHDANRTKLENRADVQKPTDSVYEWTRLAKPPKHKNINVVRWGRNSDNSGP